MKKVFVVSPWSFPMFYLVIEFKVAGTVFFLFQAMKFTFVGSKVYILTLGFMLMMFSSFFHTYCIIVSIGFSSMSCGNGAWGMCLPTSKNNM